MTGNFPNFVEMAAGSPSTPPPPDPTPSPSPPLPPPPPPVSAACQIDYTIVTQWNSGFHADLTAVNRSTAPVSGYTLTWTFTSGERFSSGWNANYSQNGNVVTVSNPAGFWNGTIAASGGSVTFGFIGTGTPRQPTGFTLNGVACSGT